MWTDGSKQVTKDAEIAGSGVYGFFPQLRRRNVRVGGEANANSFRAELIVLVLALNMANPRLPLMIYSDSMSALQLLMRWRRVDFAPRMEDEEHYDVVTALLDVIRARIAPTHFVWVKAHCGDPGNEVAGFEAGIGCCSKEILFQRTTELIALYCFDSQELITKRGWTTAVERFTRAYEGEVQRERLVNTSDAISTASLTQLKVGLELLGLVLQDPTIPEQAIRDLLQCRASNLPTAVTVSSNKGGSTCELCPLCKAAPETLSHVFI